ncbi:MAG: hypothetical protein J1E81_05965 [Eubacterium sp.]|nr:hypothetical protein [Eubacterium sp.]
MDRLTKRDKDGKVCVPLANAFYLALAYERLAELEDKLESGQLVDMKCKIGDTVFFDTFTNNGSTSIGIQGHEVKGYDLRLIVKNTQGYDSTEIPISEIGKSVFLNKDEAEQKISKN